MLYIFSIVTAYLILKLNIFETSRSCLRCGLFGYSSKDPVDSVLIRWLAYENQNRGDDSTGVYGNEILSKAADSARNFMFTQAFFEATDNAKMIIGHTRKATMGAKTAENAHPFQFFKSDKHTDPEIIGTHNGQIFEYIWKKICKEYDIAEPEVDSKIIYQLIQKLKFDYDEALSQIDGAMALAWTRPEFNSDKTGNYLYLYRRQSRPLHIGFIGSSMYYSSDSEPLHLIGCDSIDELDIDKIYTFRNGGLLGVSPIKKPRITTIRADQSIATWLNTTATQEEKIAVGICGVDAQNSKNVNSKYHHKGSNNTMRHLTTEGGQSSNFPNPKQIHRKGWDGIAPEGQLLLLDKFDTEPYKYEASLSPGRGKFYSSGNHHCCYIIIQLMDTRDGNVTLPAWLVRSHHDNSITTLTAHNGIGVLEVPASKCNSPFEIDIINPLQPNVVYKTSIDRPISGRVLEVALFVPFPASEETYTHCKDKIGFRLFTGLSPNATEGQTSRIHSFSEWMAFTENSRKNEKILQIGHDFIQDGTSKRMGQLYVPTGTKDDGSGDFHEGNKGKCGAARIEMGVLSNEYDKETDILGMDVYTTGCNLDEIELHLNKINDCQAAIDRAGETDPIHVLTSVEGFLDYLKSYFKSRLDQMKEEEIVDAISNVEPYGLS